MKKIVTLLLLSGLIKAQVPQPTVEIVDSPLQVCLGDSMLIAVRFIPPAPHNTTSLTKVYFQTFGSPTPTMVWNQNYQAFYSMPKTYMAPDTFYYFKLYVSTTMATGLTQVKVGNTARNVQFKNCTVGIKEFYPDEDQPVYRDLNTNVILPRPGEIIVEQRGQNRKKIYIFP